eukprot:TRINITY_DN3324_c0_g1_i1.p1 TRINITY_DN3324_c0_g1~~TRINITY_DN3324_c0_g1_i1.p1  ORF type:complete len:401 (-),score=100.13 TRINITY_DN3324_c0_g1_i1:72-1274(-)
MESGNEHRVDSKLFWVISLPNASVPKSAFEELQQKATPICATPPRKWNIPNLRVGTLDSLMALSDELVRKDQFVELTTKKIARQLVDLVVDEEKEAGQKKGKADKIQLVVNGVDVNQYLQGFVWDEAKYKLSSPLSDVVDAIVTTVGKMEEELRTKVANFQSVTQALASEHRKKTGNLMVRDLAEFITAHPDCYADTEHLATIFVIIPKFQTKEFFHHYESLLNDETLGGGVVPESATLLGEDQDNQIYSVVLFKKLVNEWKVEARKKKWNLRDYAFNPESLSTGAEEKKKLDSKKIKQKKNLVRWCRVNFGEAFMAWTHLKAVRVYVETILRYGLPTDFTAILLEPGKKNDKKARQLLDTLYKNIGSVYLQDDETDEAEAGPSNEKFYSYVWTPIKVSL